MTCSKVPVILLNMAVGIFNDRESEILTSVYAQPVSDAGAIPMLIPSIEKPEIIEGLLDRADGVLLIGGKDYPPEYYGCTPAPETDRTRMRAHFDIAFGQSVMKRRMPVLGICAGCQLLNILAGGKLIQHLPDANSHRGGVFHTATIRQEGIASRCLGLKPGDSFTVNSFHHQAVDPAYLGKGVSVTASAFDGSPEIIEIPGPRMVLGVQFHPERMDDLAPLFFGLLKREAAAYALATNQR